MKKSSLLLCSGSAAAVMLAASTSFGAVPYTDDLGFQLRSTAYPPRLTCFPRHPEIKNLQTVNAEGKKVTRIPGPAANKRYTAYTSVNGMVGKGKAPGTLIVTTEGTFNGEVAKANYSLNYNRKGGRNGSAGREAKSFTVGKAGKYGQSLEFTVPPEAFAIQYIFGFDGKPGSSWEISRLSFEFAPDHVELKKIMPPHASKPSTWADKYCATADCFFNVNNAQAADARTSVKIGYDDKNLYLGYVCSEPSMEVLADKITERDGHLWNGDCVEFFFFDPEKDVVKQFITNPAGAMFDIELAQAQAGDPYKGRPWDGNWSVKKWKNKNSWEVTMIIPWKTLGFDSVPTYPVAVNFGRERFADKMVSHWNCYQGKLNEVNNFAKMDFVKKELVRSRKIEKINYIPKRSKKLFKELLGKEKTDWLGFIWSSEYYLVYQAPAVRAKHTLESIVPHQKKMLKAYGEARVAGPGLPYTFLPRNTKLTRADYEEAHKLYGTRLTQTVKFSAGVAKNNGAKPTAMIGTRLVADPADPAAIQLMINSLNSTAAKIKKDPELRKLIAYLHGIDEPTNPLSYIYSRTRNSANAADIEAVAQEIKTKYGFGKYTMDDRFGDAGPARHFDRIAFWRWWNDRFAVYTKTLGDHARKIMPDIPHQVFNRNTCAGTDTIDVALCGNQDFYISSDPYPTSSRSYFGMGRALYHTGYSVKLLKDLAPKAKAGFFGQAFNYCGGTPTRADLREWASQALKNGVDQFTWYAQDALHTNPEVYNEALEISRFISNMPKLVLPKTTKTAIYYSDYDRWGLNEGGTHPTYTVYALLGEHIGSWFRFVSKHNLDLKGIKQLYIPRMRYSDADLTAKILDFARQGGTLIVLDPSFLTWNIDGSSIAERDQVIGTKLVKKEGASMSLKYNRTTLPLARVMHTSTVENGSLHSFDFAKLPAGAKVLATYQDGKPAIIERAFGKGKVIFSAVQPFGISDAAITPGGWKNFVADRARAVGEKTGLGIWYFQLPEVKNKHFNVVGLK